MRFSAWSSDGCSSDLLQPCDDIVRQCAAVWEAEDVGAVDVVIVSICSAGARYGDARQDVSEQKVSRIIVFVKKRTWRAAPLKCSDLSAGGFDERGGFDISNRAIFFHVVARDEHLNFAV